MSSRAIIDPVVSPGPPRRLVVGSVLAFWAGFVALTSLRALAVGFAEPGDLFPRRLACALAGLTLTFAFLAALRSVRGLKLWGRVAAVVAGAVPVTLVYALFNWLFFYGLDPPPSLRSDVARWGAQAAFEHVMAEYTTSWFFFFVGLGLFYLILNYAFEVADIERRAAAADRAAHAAQMRALRYQLNPHFLFNSLNALSCLVLENRAREADRMILDLSALLRRILADPTSDGGDLGDTTLAEEFELQRLYLAIEVRRFEDRLIVDVELPPELAAARIPALIVQPLVENAVKHGVGRAGRTVTVHLVAWAEGRTLAISITDDGPPPPPPSARRMRRSAMG